MELTWTSEHFTEIRDCDFEEMLDFERIRRIFNDPDEKDYTQAIDFILCDWCKRNLDKADWYTMPNTIYGQILNEFDRYIKKNNIKLGA